MLHFSIIWKKDAKKYQLTNAEYQFDVLASLCYDFTPFLPTQSNFNDSESLDFEIEQLKVHYQVENELESENKDFNEALAVLKKSHKQKVLFEGMCFFLGRECPREYLTLMIRYILNYSFYHF